MVLTAADSLYLFCTRTAAFCRFLPIEPIEISKSFENSRIVADRLPPKDTRTNLQITPIPNTGGRPSDGSFDVGHADNLDLRFSVTVKGAAVRTRRHAGPWSSRGSRRPTMLVRAKRVNVS